MKKIFTILVFAFFVASNAYAGLVSYTTLSGDAGLSYSHLNDSFNVIYDEFNGSISTLNIQAGTLSEDDFSDSINPRVRDYEFLGNFTYSGMIPATATGFTSDISAGTSYVQGYRVVTAATSKTYSASKDTWVYIDQNGAFQYVETALGASAPTTPTNSLLLAKVTTDAADITTVTDLRQTTPPAMRIYQDLKLGAVLSRDITDADVVNVGAGTIDFGSGIATRRNTSEVDVDFATNGRNGLDTGSLAAGYYAIWAVPDDANETNYECVGSASFSATSLAITGERLIGWCYANSATTISVDSVGAYRGVGGDAPNVYHASDSGSTTITSGTLTTLDSARFYSSGRPCLIQYGAVGQETAGDETVSVIASVSIDSLTIPASHAAWKTGDDYHGGGSYTLYHVLGKGGHTLDYKIVPSQNHIIQGWFLIIQEL